MVLSPRTNYTDWATATCRRSLVPTFVDRRVSRGQRGGSPTVVNLKPDIPLFKYKNRLSTFLTACLWVLVLYSQRNRQTDFTFLTACLWVLVLYSHVPDRKFCESAWLTEGQTALHYLRFEVFTAVTIKNVVSWDKNPVHISQERHYVSAIELSRLILCKIWGLHGGDCTECCLLR
jgi:hypothetical protein